MSCQIDSQNSHQGKMRNIGEPPLSSKFFFIFSEILVFFSEKLISIGKIRNSRLCFYAVSLRSNLTQWPSSGGSGPGDQVRHRYDFDKRRLRGYETNNSVRDNFRIRLSDWFSNQIGARTSEADGRNSNEMFILQKGIKGRMTLAFQK